MNFDSKTRLLCCYFILDPDVLKFLAFMIYSFFVSPRNCYPVSNGILPTQRQPYGGPHQRLVISFDLGTTFSAVSYWYGYILVLLSVPLTVATASSTLGPFRASMQ